MNFLDMILTPFRYVVSWILWAFHELFTFIGMDPNSGWTWTLSIIFLVLLIRTALIPVFVKQIKAERAMQALQPDLRKLQAKYKGKKDQLSQQAMIAEQRALFKKHKTNPMSSCLPMLIQMPFFFALFRVLNSTSQAIDKQEGIGKLSLDNIHSFDASSIFGARLSETFLGTINSDGPINGAVIVVAIVMILAMTASQFITQKQIMSKNMTKEALEGPFMQQQKIMLYILPLVFGIGGINFPIGVLIYWTATNVWTLGQQYYVIRKNPTPGSAAERELNERRAAKGLPPVGQKKEDADAAAEAIVEAPKVQRVQPQRKNRKKK